MEQYILEKVNKWKAFKELDQDLKKENRKILFYDKN